LGLTGNISLRTLGGVKYILPYYTNAVVITWKAMFMGASLIEICGQLRIVNRAARFRNCTFSLAFVVISCQLRRCVLKTAEQTNGTSHHSGHMTWKSRVEDISHHGIRVLTKGRQKALALHSF
jgi:hypothetical protein